MNRVTMWEDRDGTGYHQAIECAVAADGTSPAAAFFTDLRAGAQLDDPNHNPTPDEEQVHDYFKLLAKIEHLGRYGGPDRRGDINYLHDGIWELKHGVRRVSYWDTPGDGTFVPRPKVEDIRTISPAPDPNGYWWYPRMDAILRLGLGWHKDGQKTDQQLIVDSIELRSEDSAHDE